MKRNKLKDNAKKRLIKEVINEQGNATVEDLGILYDLFMEEGFDIPIYIIVLQDNGDAYYELCRISNLEQAYLYIKDRLICVHIEGSFEIEDMIEDKKLDIDNISELVKQWTLLTITI